jgi:hypothetical protein
VDESRISRQHRLCGWQIARFNRGEEILSSAKADLGRM